MEAKQILGTTAVRSVFYYTASPVTSCDRCSQGIKHVAQVTYKDGLVQKYGLDCIEKILAAVPDLRTLYLRNAKLLTKYQRYLQILTGPAEDMPYGREYFNSGQYFIGDGNGKDLFCFDSWAFHPLCDWEKNQSGNQYVIKDKAASDARCQDDINRKVIKLRSEIERIEGFLARVLSKAGMVAAQG